jgi:hypothetical protein
VILHLDVSLLNPGTGPITLVPVCFGCYVLQETNVVPAGSMLYPCESTYVMEINIFYCLCFVLFDWICWYNLYTFVLTF